VDKSIVVSDVYALDPKYFGFVNPRFHPIRVVIGESSAQQLIVFVKSKPNEFTILDLGYAALGATNTFPLPDEFSFKSIENFI
jgi:hypothetical protein